MEKLNNSDLLIPNSELLNEYQYNHIKEIIGGYRVEPHLRDLKKQMKEEVDYGIECGTGGNTEVLKILNGSPFVSLRIPADYDQELASRNVATGYDAQAMVVDTLWNLNIKFGMVLDGSTYDYYLYIPVDEQGCRDFGMKSKSIRGGSVWYDDDARVPVMYQLKLNSIEKAKYGRAKDLCQKRWDAFDKKHGFIRDKNDLACHQDGTRVTAEEMASIMNWDYLGGDGQNWIKRWQQLDSEYMDEWGDIYKSPQQKNVSDASRETTTLRLRRKNVSSVKQEIQEPEKVNRIEQNKKTYTDRPFGDWDLNKKDPVEVKRSSNSKSVKNPNWIDII